MDIINDNFADAIVLNGNSISTTGSNLAATGEFGEPDHAGVNIAPSLDTNSVWWTWTASASGSIVIDTFGSDFDTSLAVYIGSELSQLVEIVNNDDTSGLQSEVSFFAIAGETYQIAVDGYGSSQGSIVLNLDLETIPPINWSPVPGAMANFGFESADFSSVVTLGNTAVEGDSFGISPTEGDFQASLSTLDSDVTDDAIASFLGLDSGSLDGLGNGDATVGSAIRLTTIEVEAGEVLSFNWNFLTNEIPSTAFNDFAFVVIGEPFTLANTNSVSVPNPFLATETRYQQFEFTFAATGTYDIGFGIMDVGDGSVDSVLLVDNIRLFSEIGGTGAGETLTGSDASERIKGLGGNDVLIGNGGADVLLGGGGSDILIGGADADFVDGGGGSDTLVGGNGSNRLIGGEGNDTSYGGQDADIIDAGGGNDTAYGGAGADILTGGGGRDTLYGGAGADLMNGGAGQDFLYGDGGNDTIYGGAGNDTIYGGAGADILNGGTGSDIIFADGGGDIVNSGPGLDTIWIAGGAATIFLELGNGFDTLHNFQFGSTLLRVSDIEALSFADSANGARIFQGGDLLAVV